MSLLLFGASEGGGGPVGTFVHCASNGGNVDVLTGSTGVSWGTAGAAAQSGDLAIIPWVFLNTVTPTNPTSESWTQVLDNTAGATDCRGRILSLSCDGTESGEITGWSNGGTANRQAAILLVLRGYQFISGFAVRDETANSTSHDCPALTTSDGFGGNFPANGDTILTFAFDRAASTAAIAPPSGWSVRTNGVFAATGTGGTVVGVADDGLTDAASFTVDPAAWTGFVSSDDAFTVTMSLRPTAGGNATATPAVIACTTAIPQSAVNVQAGPMATTATAALPQATPAAVTLATPTTIAAIAALPTPSVNASVGATVLAATVSVSQPTVNVGAGPTVIPVVVSLPQATPQTGGNATATPSAIATTVTIPRAAANMTSGPTVVAATVALPRSAVNIAAGPAVVPVTVTLPTAGVNSGAGPVAISAVVTLPAPGVNVTAGPAVVQVAVTLPQASAIDEGAQINGTSSSTVAGLTSIATAAALAAVAVVTQGNSSTSVVSDG